MATKELDVLMQKKESNGDTNILYPITKIKNIIDEDHNSLDDFLLDFVSAVITEEGDYLITENGSYIIAGS